MPKLNRNRFRNFLRSSGDHHVFTTFNVNTCPLADYLQTITGDHALWVTDDKIITGKGKKYPLPEWARQFSRSDEIGDGHHMVTVLDNIPMEVKS